MLTLVQLRVWPRSCSSSSSGSGSTRVDGYGPSPPLSYNWRPALLLTCLLVLACRAAASAMDPAVGGCEAGWLVPAKSFFQGWFTSFVDPVHGRRFHVFITLTPCTNQSYVGVLSCLPHVGHMGCVTQASAAFTQDFQLTVKKSREPVRRDPDYSEPPSFEWRSPQHGSYRVEGNMTHIHLNVGTVMLHATLSQQGPWRRSRGLWGPETWLGSSWAGGVLPQYYEHSLSSHAQYHFTNASDAAYWMGVFGTAWAHEAKSWGSALPSAHAWGDATSSSSSTQVVFALAYFNMSLVSLPYLAFIGFRSKKLSLAFRSTDVGTLFSNISANACDGRLQLTGSTYSYELRVNVHAPSWCFSPPLLAPNVGSNWTYTCSECLRAQVDLELAEQTAWGLVGIRRVLERHSLGYGSLNFGGDLLCATSDIERAENKLFIM